METPLNDEEKLSAFLYRVNAPDGVLLDLLRTRGAEALLEQEGGKLSPDNYKALLTQRRGPICKALAAEWQDFESEDEDDADDVELHGNPHFGPCWILVG